MMLFSKHPNERDIKKMKEAIPFMKKIKFFAQREIQDDDYLLLSKHIRNSTIIIHLFLILQRTNFRLLRSLISGSFAE